MREQRHQFPVVVHTVLQREGKVFLLRRAAAAAYGGMYALPGGYLEAGEGLQDAALRECFEEVGVRVTEADLAVLMTYRSESSDEPGAQGLNAIFVAREFEGAPVVMEPDQFTDGVFVSPQELPSNLVPWLEKALDIALDRDRQGARLYEYVWD